MGISDATASSMHAIFAMAQSKEEADAFFSQVKTPVGLEENDPILRLRQRMEQDVSAHATGSVVNQLDGTVKNALWMIAFNKWILGEPVITLRWRPGGSKPESFPEVVGFPFVPREKK